MKDGDAVHTLHLAELDDTGLAAPRVLQVLAALDRACEIPRDEHAMAPSSGPAGTLG